MRCDFGKRCLVILLLSVIPAFTQATEPESARLHVRPAAPVHSIEPGVHALDLGGRRDGILYVPRGTAPGPQPLLVLLHGNGQEAKFFRFLFPLAEESGVVLLAVDSRGRTWDGIRGRYGPDIRFIDGALRHAFERVAVDPRRIAIGGFSDGATYALYLGLGNGDLFTHVVAFTPGSIARPEAVVGQPRLFIAHGTADTVLNIDRTSRRVVPVLRGAGYDVTYEEFDGPHTVPVSVARAALGWLAGTE